VVVAGDVKGGEWVDHSFCTGRMSQLIHDVLIAPALAMLMIVVPAVFLYELFSLARRRRATPA
jgi:hypothetical protein